MLLPQPPMRQGFWAGLQQAARRAGMLAGE
jgi:hypothetical protein